MKIFCPKDKIDFLYNHNDQWRILISTFATKDNLYEQQIKFLDTSNFGTNISANYCIFKLRYIRGINIKLRIALYKKTYLIKKIITLQNYLQIIGIEL